VRETGGVGRLGPQDADMGEYLLNMTVRHTQASEQEMGCGRTVTESLDWRQRIERTFKK